MLQERVSIVDGFSGPMLSMVNSIQAVLNTFGQLDSALSSGIDPAFTDTLRTSIEQSQQACAGLSRAFHDIEEQVQAAPPVQIPVEWHSPRNIEIFQSSGIERYRQELSGANGLINQLAAAQQRITQNAIYGDILPPNAANDMIRIGERINAIQQRIARISANPMDVVSDTESRQLEQLREQLNNALQLQNEMNAAVERMDVTAANEAYRRLAQIIDSTDRHIRDNIGAQQNFNSSVREGTSGTNKLLSLIKSAAGAYLGIQGMGKVLNISDTLTSTTARLGNMNDAFNDINGTALQTNDIINMVYGSAQRARGSFSGMAAVVAKFGNNAGDAFGSQAEVVKFAELIQKQMTISGAGASEASNAMLQLSQALGSGVLRGDELNSVFEQAPGIIRTIADYLGVSIGEIRGLASEGKITADIIKNAMFDSADKINAQFEDMPQTFSQTWTSFKNNAMMAFQPVLQRLNEIANSENFVGFVDSAVGALSTLAGVALDIFEAVANVGGFITDNWGVISPVIMSVTAALGAYYAMRLAVNAAELIGKGIRIAACLAAYAHAAATGTEVSATAAATAAQYGLNTALLACPITWIVGGFLAAAAAVGIYTNYVNDAYGLSLSFSGMLGGSLMVVLAALGNMVIMIYNIVAEAILEIWNSIALFINFFANVWTDPIGSVARLFIGLFDVILAVVETVAGAIGSLFGADWSSGIQGFRDKLKAATKEVYGEGMIDLTVDEKLISLDYIDYNEAFDAGYYMGDSFQPTDYLKDFDPDKYAFDGLGDETQNLLSEIAVNTGDTADALDITSEDLKYMRDIAECDTINRFTTAEIKVEWNNTQNISSDMDVDGVMDYFATELQTVLETTAEGVHS